MRAAIIAMMLMFGSQAGAECGNLCDQNWWETATEADVQAELDAGADVLKHYKPNNYKEITLLHYAVSAGNLANIEILLRAGADVLARNDGGQTPLHLAAKHGSNVIRLLGDAGADAKLHDANGYTPLHNVAKNGKADGIDALLELGAYVNAENQWGQTALHMAASLEQDHPAEIIDRLLLAGAGVSALDLYRQTPLHQIVWNGTVEHVNLLLEAGANVSAKDIQGRTPLHHAAKFGKDPAIIQLFLDLGVTRNMRNDKIHAIWEEAKENRQLRGTKAYWNLNEARFK